MLSALDFARRIEAGELTPRAAVDRCAQAIAEREGEVAAFAALDIEAARRDARLARFGAAEGARMTAVFDRDLIGAGATIDGPALLEEETTTTAVLAGQRLHVDARGLLLIEDLTAP